MVRLSRSHASPTVTSGGVRGAEGACMGGVGGGGGVGVGTGAGVAFGALAPGGTGAVVGAGGRVAQEARRIATARATRTPTARDPTPRPLDMRRGLTAGLRPWSIR